MGGRHCLRNRSKQKNDEEDKEEEEGDKEDGEDGEEHEEAKRRKGKGRHGRLPPCPAHVTAERCSRGWKGEQHIYFQNRPRDHSSWPNGRINRSQQDKDSTD
jgi:hypothetical protein